MPLDILAGIFGQREKPNISFLNPEEILAKVSGQMPQLAALAKTQAEGGARAQRAAEDIFDPYQAPLRHETSQAILDDLRLGGELPDDVRRTILQRSLERGSAAGFGASPAGRNLTARDLGLTSLDLRNLRLDRAGQFARSAPVLDQIFNPSSAIGPQDFANLILQNQADQNRLKQTQADTRTQNRMNMITQPLQIASSVYDMVNPGASMLNKVLKGSSIGTNARIPRTPPIVPDFDYSPFQSTLRLN